MTADSLFPPLKQGPVSNQVVEHVTELVVGGRLAAGEFLPTESALRRRLGVGRSTVREAMRVLEARGLVQSRHGVGVAVADRSHEASFGTLSLLLQRNKGSLRDLLEVRLGLKTRAAALAASRATPADIAAMQAAIATMRRESSTVDEYVQADLLFHLQLAQAAHNRVLVVLLDAVNDLLLVSIHATYRLDGHTARRLEDHTHILRAVERQDPSAAEQAIAVHLRSTEAMLRQLDLLQAGPAVQVECFGLEAPLERPFAFSQAWVARRRAVLVRLETADGLEGWGEVYCQVPVPVYVALLAELFAPLLLGADPWDREVLWQRLYRATIDAGQRGLIVGALSALDIAMWDLAGRDCGQPVHRLLGGLARESVACYATGMYRRPGDDWVVAMADEARAHRAAGFGTLKMKVGFGLAPDVAAVRAAVGPDIALAVDANHAYRAVQATELGRRIADQEIAWFEEPVSPEDLAGYREVRDRQPIPVAGGELAYTRFGFRDILAAGAVDIAQPDLCLAGGLSGGRAIADLARTWGVRCWPHVWGAGIAQAAAVQFLGWLPEGNAMECVDPPLLEWDRTENPLRERVVPGRPMAHDGRVAVPRGPGLGVAVDRRALARHQVAHAVAGA